MKIKIRSLLERIAWRFIRLIVPYRPPQIAPDLQIPDPCKGTVVITGLGSYGFEGKGKVQSGTFFPPFAYTLYAAGIETIFVSRKKQYISKVSGNNTCTIHIYNEEKEYRDKFLNNNFLQNTGTVFNGIEIGEILQRKDLTNEHLGKAGILVPRIMETITEGELVFSNTVTGTATEVSIIDQTNSLIKGRYNTEFVETRRDFCGVSYYTTVRLMSVGRELVHAFVRIRPDTNASPSVHAADCPLDPGALEYFQEILVDDRKDELIKLSRRLGDALGLAFFAHDLLVSSESGRIYVCESNLKFHDFTYTDHLVPISAYLPSHAVMFSSQLARRSAEAFLRECQRKGCFLD